MDRGVWKGESIGDEFPGKRQAKEGEEAKQDKAGGEMDSSPPTNALRQVFFRYVMTWASTYTLGMLRDDAIAGLSPPFPTTFLRVYSVFTGHTIRHHNLLNIIGVTVFFLLIPQGLSYAVLAEVPPVYGLYTSVFPAFGYLLFGTSMQVIQSGFTPFFLHFFVDYALAQKLRSVPFPAYRHSYIHSQLSVGPMAITSLLVSTTMDDAGYADLNVQEVF